MTRVYVSIGSNIDRQQNIRSALDALQHYYGRLTSSTVYESEPVGLEGDNFYNLVVAFDTAQSAAELVATLREIESRHWRSREGKRYTSRTLDLDLLLYGDEVIEQPGLVIPREEIVTSAFVLWPLAEVAGNQRHPVTGETFAGMWARFDKSRQPIWPVAMGSVNE